MQGEHTPTWVAGSTVEGFRVIGLEPDQLWGCSARSSAMDKPMMEVELGAAFALVDPPAAAGVSAGGGGIDCVKAAVPVPADPLTAPHPERWGPGAIALRHLEVPGLRRVIA